MSYYSKATKKDCFALTPICPLLSQHSMILNGQGPDDDSADGSSPDDDSADGGSSTVRLGQNVTMEINMWS